MAQQTVRELGAKVRGKYPEYADIPDDELGRRIKAKYPAEYADFADVAQTPQQPLNPTSALTSKYLPPGFKGPGEMPLLPAEEAVRTFLPKEEMKGNVLGIPKETLAGAALGTGKVISDVTRPTTLAAGAGLGVLGTAGFPGFLLTALLSGDMLRGAYNRYKESQATPQPGALPRDQTAGKFSAGLDALLAALPWLHEARGMRAGKPSVQPSEPPPMSPAETPAPALPQQSATPVVQAPPAAPPMPQFPETRGQGTQYHGTSTPIEQLQDYFYSPLNYYGQGLYTTDALDIAHGYSKKGGGKSPSVYKVSETQPTKLYDMEKPIEGWLTQKLKEDPSDIVKDALDQKPKNLRELYDHIRELGTDEWLSADSIQEIYDTIGYNIQQQGYQGVSHTGGLKSKKAPHKVNIYFEPSKNVSIEPYSANQPTPYVSTKPKWLEAREASDAARTQAYQKATEAQTPPPTDVSGTTKDKSAADLFDQILKAQDTSVSKRDLLGINKKKSSKDTPLPMFKEKGLF